MIRWRGVLCLVLSNIQSQPPPFCLNLINHGAAAGEQEIDAAVDKTREAVGGMRQGEDVVVLPLYSSLPHHLQIKAIAPAGRHVRRKVRAPMAQRDVSCPISVDMVVQSSSR